MHAPRPVRPLCASLAMLATTCAVAPEDDLGSAAEPVVNGTPASPTTMGVARVQTPTQACSGTMLTNSWVLSARSCFTAEDVRNPAQVSVSLGSATRVGAEVLLSPHYEVALVRLSAPHALGLLATTRGWEVNLYVGTLQGLAVRCMGYGSGTYTDAGVGTTLRQADVRFIDGADGALSVTPNASGQVPWVGDTGGPCFASTPDGRRLLAGVATSFAYVGTSATPTARYQRAWVFRPWAAESLVSHELVMRHSGRCVRARDRLPGSLLDQRTCDGDGDQRWRFEHGGGLPPQVGYLRVRDTVGGLCLTAQTGGIGAGSLVLSPCDPPAYGHAFLPQDMGGGYQRLGGGSGCLAVANASAADGVTLQLSPCDAGHSQQFVPRAHVAEGAFELAPAGSSKCLDVPATPTDGTQAVRPGELVVISGARLRTTTCTLGANQRFRPEEVANGEFLVRPQHGNLCLEVVHGSVADGAQVQQVACHGGASQRFRMLFRFPGQYQLQNVNSGRCLEAPPASAADGTLIQQVGCHSGASQRWQVRL